MKLGPPTGLLPLCSITCVCNYKSREMGLKMQTQLYLTGMTCTIMWFWWNIK